MKGQISRTEADRKPRRFRFLCGVLLAAYCVCVFHPMSPVSADAARSSVSPAKAECVMEANTRRILYERNGEEKLPMASTTKILTAITVLEHCDDIKEEFEIPSEAQGVEGSSIYLKSGELYSVEDLLYGLMLRSGNDSAEALALHTAGSIEKFCFLMNETAQKAGALKSYFKNPHGLPCDEHYTTARDLTLISCYAMQNPEFKKIVATKYYRPRGWANKNKMLKNYSGGIGIKTGYTQKAGRCLVSAAEREGMTLICTVLNCSMMYERSSQLLDDAFSAYENVRILGADTPVPVKKDGKNITGCTREDLYYPLLPEEEQHLRIEFSEAKNNPKTEKNGEIIGQIEIYLINRLLFSRNLYEL